MKERKIPAVGRKSGLRETEREKNGAKERISEGKREKRLRNEKQKREEK